MKLNLGAGKLPRKGFINIDISPDVKADYVLDVTKGLPYKDNSIEEIHSGCMLEQIGDNKDFIFLLNEIWRVLKPQGEFNGYVPSTAFSVLYLDPMDKRFFQLESFNYFDIDKHAYKEFGTNYGLKPWKDVNVSLNENGIIYFSMCPVK